MTIIPYIRINYINICECLHLNDNDICQNKYYSFTYSIYFTHHLVAQTIFGERIQHNLCTISVFKTKFREMKLPTYENTENMIKKERKL